MPVDNQILALLEDRNIEIKFEHEAAKSRAEQSCIVDAVLLHDGVELIQILIPRGYLIDIQALSIASGKTLVSPDNSKRNKILSEYSATNVPAIPNWHGLPCILDKKLLRYTNLLLSSGSNEGALAISQEDFAKITSRETVFSFAEPIGEVDHDLSLDEIKIRESLQHFTHLRIRQRLEETLEMPPLPQTAQRVIDLRADPDADINKLSEIVELDPSLAAQVVSWASSPYYSAPGKVKSVHDAIMRVLGFDMVLNLALGISLGNTMDNKEITNKQLKHYWLDSVYCAAALEALVSNIPRANRPSFGMAYLAGLLHNYGFLVLSEVFPPYCVNINKYQQANPHLDPMTVEQFLLGASGNQIAAWLLNSWNMPSEVVVAMRQQHNPGYEGEHAHYAHLVYIANQLLAEQGFGERVAKPIPDSLFESLGLDREAATQSITNLIQAGPDLDEIAARLMH